MAKSAHRGDKDKGEKGGKDKGDGPLQEAWKRYEAGDHVGARREAQGVLDGQPSDAERAEAQALIARTGPPTWTWPYAAAAAVLLALMLALAITRG
ncbi:MAG TPA: molecular chaperone DnaJ [Myxococcaceae bacterium]|jgi:hypothetical protein